MVNLLVFILSLYQLNTVTFSELVDTPKFAANTLNNDDYDSNSQPELPPDVMDYPIVKTAGDETEIDFEDPIASVNIDYLSNAIVLQFKKQRQKQRQEALNNNFMRFGRADKNLMRFGKRQLENVSEQLAMSSFRPGTRFERSNGAEGIRDSRGDNFMRFGRSTGGEAKSLMRFGRSSNDFMRFGRAPSDFMRFGRAPSDFMRFGRTPSDFMRFGRAPNDFMRFGRAPSDFMRFGRAPSDFMRFGRTPSDFMRFGRAPSDFMRFGRAPSDFMRFGRAPSDFMRFGRAPLSSQNLMRFGRSNGMMRFGRADQSFMRFGKADASGRSDIDKNFMRFGRPDSFMRFGRTPNTDLNTNFMRFGKRQKDDSSSSTTEQNHTERDIKTPLLSDTSTVSPYLELENDLEPIDMMFLNDLTNSMANDDN